MKKKMNLPNKLTVLRICLVPIILVLGMLTPKSIGGVETIWFYLSCALCALVFGVASITDMLDGKIARKQGLITDFGKFLDPVADKFMVIGALFVILYKFPTLEILMIITLIVVVFRELAVTAIRMVVAGNSNLVIAADKLGKIKTVTQIVAICVCFLEPVLRRLTELAIEAISKKELVWKGAEFLPLSWLAIIFALVMTVWSGLNYILSYWKYLDPEK